MTVVLYAIERPFMRKTFEAIDRHVDVASAFLPVRDDARGCSDRIDEIDVRNPDAVDENVRAIDPGVVVYNHRFGIERFTFYEEYPLVHLRHGASIGRGEIEVTTATILERVAAALAPGERWARAYRAVAPRDVRIAVVGIPEADELVDAPPPRERRILYAPTNYKVGRGAYANTARSVVECFADTEYELLFRPHPTDRREGPGLSVTRECRERIAEIPNVVFDTATTPTESMRRSDVLVSDYSGAIAEWLHTGRPLVQLTAIDAPDREVPRIGVTTDAIDLELVDDLYSNGEPPAAKRRRASWLDRLGIPMDGRAGERAAREVCRCAG
ncbi:CDP-glycerol glycerophosphotransferase family protein [Natrinema longum]|uniref:CDP-glycerol glycerophosphotransferase family protein n=1 Tax=Natrinema longum TaxID=370324 RepID=A0A8A2U335_9EURY|nr:CDP-glycerol glycerophosphotransferase family protein [Natrinema longum]MBZ6494985.1 CDP-glycerol glycerophosphotransferase family protein [Natrinema longum]QSW83719.1 CDP-glycerol glycerophosphotransferase family protein [Natrinema longum]